MGQDKVVIGKKVQTLFVVAANVSLNSTPFETVIAALANSRKSPSVFIFEHIRYFDLFRGQLRNFYPDEASEMGDDIANALLVIWEVDRVMQYNHWEQLKKYIASFSPRTPCPLLLLANLSEGIICAPPDYVRRLARDIQGFLTASFDDTPSKHLWKCLFMRNNLFHMGYFSAHIHWLHSRSSRHPEVHVPANWQELRKNQLLQKSEDESDVPLLNADHIPHMSLVNGEVHRFLNTAHSKAEWYQGVEGSMFIKVFGNGAMRDMTPTDFQTFMAKLSQDVADAESSFGVQEWRCRDGKDQLFVADIVTVAKNARQTGPLGTVHLLKPVRPWEATLLVAQAIPRIRASRQSEAITLHVPELPAKRTATA